jgi:hypothetical protein
MQPTPPRFRAFGFLGIYGIIDDNPADAPDKRRISKAERSYTETEAVAVAKWLNERAAGYPRLARYEGGKLWPKFNTRLDPVN